MGGVGSGETREDSGEDAGSAASFVTCAWLLITVQGAFGAGLLVGGAVQQSGRLLGAGGTLLAGTAVSALLRRKVGAVTRVSKLARIQAGVVLGLAPLCAALLPLALPALALLPVVAIGIALPYLRRDALRKLVVLSLIDEGLVLGMALTAGRSDSAPPLFLPAVVCLGVLGASVVVLGSMWRFGVRLQDIAKRESTARRASEDVLAVVSHDLRNPLQLVKLAASALGRQPDSSLAPALTARHVAAISRGAERMERLIQDLLDLSSIESGRLHLSLHEHAVEDLLDEALELLESAAQQKDVRLAVTGSGQDTSLLCDRTKILQAITNLVGNAIKFTPEGGTVRISVRVQRGWMTLAVHDRGPGIAPEHVPFVFERYWQAKGVPRGGLGLGLAIARGIVDAHGGRIEVRSTPGESTEFSFSLPLGVAARAATAERVGGREGVDAA